MADGSLVVPVQLDALVVNAATAARDQFREWPFNYLALDEFHSPTAEPSFATSPLAQGVHLHWVLPQALRAGSRAASGEMEYPLVPNRWLVARFGGTGPTVAWVVESDCPTRTVPATTTPTSMYLVEPSVASMWAALGSDDPRRSQAALTSSASGLRTAQLGVSFGLTGWTEKAETAMFLTAVAPGNPLFSVYYAHSRGVFGFYDDLQGIGSGTFSYLVVGWYSDSSRDVLASWTTEADPGDAYASLLGNLMWQAPGDATTQCTRSFYEGMALAVEWDAAGPPPGQAQGKAPATDPKEVAAESGVLDVAIGNNALDSFAALVGSQLADQGYDTQVIELLRAFQYDLLPVANQVNGPALIDRKIHASWFGSGPGGYWWEIVGTGDPGAADAGPSPGESAWLRQLNADQAALDAALGVLFDLQWQLNGMWWKSGRFQEVFPPPSGITSDQIANQLDPTYVDPVTKAPSLARRVLDQIAVVQAAVPKVPQPEPAPGLTAQQAFEKGIDSYATAKGLAAGKKLRAVPAPRYWHSSDPAIVLSGVDPPPELSPQSPLEVRVTGSLIGSIQPTGYASVSSAALAAAAPVVPDLSALPPEVTAIVREFTLLDPGNSAAIATLAGAPAGDVSSQMTSHDPAIYSGTLPAIGLTPWSQPWSPMFAEFSLRYAHLPFEVDGRCLWSFDGDDYHYDPGTAAPAVDHRSVGGISLLGPHSQFVFAGRLKDFAAKYGTSEGLGALEQYVDTVDHWSFLAQDLTGFGTLLSGRDARAYRRPSSDTIGGSDGAKYPVADLAGYPGAGTGAPYSIPDRYRGNVASVPYLPGNDSDPPPSYGSRHGQAYFEMLYLYDKFGRILWVITSGGQTGLHDATNFPAVVDSALMPQVKIDSNVRTVAELPPRVLQPARLDTTFVDAVDPTKILGLDPDVNPVAGWILPNHLENSVLLYAPDGRSLGEVRLTETAQGGKTGGYARPPHGTVDDMAGVAAIAPRIADVFGNPAVQDPAAFQAMLDAIDSTLWTTDPLGSRSDQNLSVLVGRPLALVRVKLALELEGPALRATGWDATVAPPDPDLPSYKFFVRLGDQATRDDGLIGYFAGGDYSSFNSIAAPDTDQAQSYVVPVGSSRSDGTPNYLQLQFAESSSADVLLLVDPRAGVHATTGILPVKRFDLPAEFVEPPLETVEVAFRVGPAVTSTRPTPAQAGQSPAYASSISYPAPAEQNGAWSWWEVDPSGDPSGFGLVDPGSAAELTGIPNRLADGFLQLVLSLEKGS